MMPINGFFVKVQQVDRVPLSNEKIAVKLTALFLRLSLLDHRTFSDWTRTAAETESRPKGGCCNCRLL